MGDDLENKVIFSKYKIEKKIGEGSFGKIYSASNITSGERCALKFENRRDTQNLLEAEACIVAYLQGSKVKLIQPVYQLLNHMAILEHIMY